MMLPPPRSVRTVVFAPSISRVILLRDRATGSQPPGKSNQTEPIRTHSHPTQRMGIPYGSTGADSNASRLRAPRPGHTATASDETTGEDQKISGAAPRGEKWPSRGPQGLRRSRSAAPQRRLPESCILAGYQTALRRVFLTRYPRPETYKSITYL